MYVQENMHLVGHGQFLKYNSVVYLNFKSWQRKCIHIYNFKIKNATVPIYVQCTRIMFTPTVCLCVIPTVIYWRYATIIIYNYKKKQIIM